MRRMAERGLSRRWLVADVVTLYRRDVASASAGVAASLRANMQAFLREAVDDVVALYDIEIGRAHV